MQRHFAIQQRRILEKKGGEGYNLIVGAPVMIHEEEAFKYSK